MTRAYIGWACNSQGVVACLGGSFWVDTSGPDGGPGGASTAAVTVMTVIGYGIEAIDDSLISGRMLMDTSPCFFFCFHRDGAV